MDINLLPCRNSEGRLNKQSLNQVQRADIVLRHYRISLDLTDNP
jgi:hypothetical protein